MRLDGTLDEILSQHATPSVERLVAETALLTADRPTIAALKLSLQVRGDGPARLVATDYYAGKGRRARVSGLCELRSVRLDARANPFQQIGGISILIDQARAPRPIPA